VVGVRERLALLLAIKEPGRTVSFQHLYDKVRRDEEYAGSRVDEHEVEEELEALVREGYAYRQGEEYGATGRIDELVAPLVWSGEAGLNRSYRLVWVAERYYPVVADLILPFLRGRAVSAVKLFSGKRDPLGEVNPIFVRYARYKPRKVPLTVGDRGRLLELVYDHCVDFIPYVHPLGAREPDLFVLDLDAGEGLLAREGAFDFVKYVAARLAELMEELGIAVMVKFSGSRGFQLWARLDNNALRPQGGDLFRLYRELAVKAQGALEERLQGLRGELVDRFPWAKGMEGFTTSQVAHREERAELVLVDWSALKPMGDVRAPLSIHYRTGLVSLPVPVDRVERFTPEQAEPRRVMEVGVAGLKPLLELGVSDPSPLLALA
jgi:DNA primase